MILPRTVDEYIEIVADEESSPRVSPATKCPVRPAKNGKIQVAAFDFDGTCIKGNSPVLLVRYLGMRHKMNYGKIALVILWAGFYKARLPQNEDWACGLVFSAFQHKPVKMVDRFIDEFYRRVIPKRFRPLADEALREHAEAGHAVIWVSASFEPIIKAATQDHYVHHVVATRMKVDENGCYTDEVDGTCVEGLEKIKRLNEFCDQQFGAGNWELGWAYGDHYTDRPMLSAARHAFAVTPDGPLERTAKKKGWTVLDWSNAEADKA